VQTLKTRFEEFIATLPGAESIDALMARHGLRGQERADYLAFDRKVIIEQKSLEVDVFDKVQAIVDRFRGMHGSMGGERMSLPSVANVIARTRDGGVFKKELLARLTQRIDDVLAKADKQTLGTRQTFSLPSAVGIVVILNDNIQLIEPDYATVKAFEMLRKTLPSGEIRYPSNQVVVLISEAHRVRSGGAVEPIPIDTIFSDEGNKLPLATECADALRQSWAEFNGTHCVEDANLARDVQPRDPEQLFRTE
jgi:hypothetical protein